MKRRTRMRKEEDVCSDIRKVEDKLNALNKEHKLIIRARIYAYLEIRQAEINGKEL